MWTQQLEGLATADDCPATTSATATATTTGF